MLQYPTPAHNAPGFLFACNAPVSEGAAIPREAPNVSVHGKRSQMDKKDLIPIGVVVRVSDGTPKPPARFTRKLADWQGRNYRGVVKEHNDYGSGPRYTIVEADSIGKCVQFQHSNVPPSKVSIEDPDAAAAA